MESLGTVFIGSRGRAALSCRASQRSLHFFSALSRHAASLDRLPDLAQPVLVDPQLLQVSNRVREVIDIRAPSPAARCDRFGNMLEFETPGVAFVTGVRHECKRLDFLRLHFDRQEPRPVYEARHLSIP